jgi:hypothetical protein
MLENERAGSGNPDESGSGAPEGGSPEGGSENDDKPITAKQLKAALASQRAHYEEKLSGQRAEFEAFKAGAGTKERPAAEKPKVYTKAELKAAVEAGQITQEQADARWDLQRDAEITERAETVALEAVTRKATKERIDADLKSYKRLKPEILERGSETREKIQEEFNYLTGIGKPADTSTELAAIRAVLGPLAKLEKAASAGRSEESHQEGGASGGGDKPKGNSSKKLVDHLKGDAKEHYERGIKQGRYKDWDAVEKELQYARPSVRQRLGLPA